MQSRISIDKCREMLSNSDKLSDEVVLSQRDRLYELARFFIEKFEEITNFVTRLRTIDAKARIVK